METLPQITDPIAALGAFGASLALGFVKRHTHALDGWLGRKLKPLQPALILAGGLGLPYLTAALGLATVDPATFATAPTATIATIVARETLRRVRGVK